MQIGKCVIVFLVLATGVASGAEKQPLTFPTEIAKAMQQDIPLGWTIRSDARSIVITRDQQVTLLNPISLPLMELDDVLREFGQKSDYLIILVFRERMTNKDYAELKVKRKHALKVISDNPNVDGKTKYGMLNRESDKYLLPTYFNARFSIYLHRTDRPPLKVYPASASDVRAKILDSVSRVMRAYEEHNN